MLPALPSSIWLHPAAAKLDVAFRRSRRETEWNCALQEIANQRRFFHESPVTSHQSPRRSWPRLRNSGI